MDYKYFIKWIILIGIGIFLVIAATGAVRENVIYFREEGENFIDGKPNDSSLNNSQTIYADEDLSGNFSIFGAATHYGCIRSQSDSKWLKMEVGAREAIDSYGLYDINDTVITYARITVRIYIEKLGATAPNISFYLYNGSWNLVYSHATECAFTEFSQDLDFENLNITACTEMNITCTRDDDSAIYIDSFSLFYYYSTTDTPVSVSSSSSSSHSRETVYADIFWLVTVVDGIMNHPDAIYIILGIIGSVGLWIWRKTVKTKKKTSRLSKWTEIILRK